jgi:uncharacterized membrane protein
LKRQSGWDFLLILAGGIVLAMLIAAEDRMISAPISVLRIILGILFVFIIPGYSLQSALFPDPKELDPLTRAAFSFGLSIAVFPLVFLLTRALGLGMNPWPIALILFFFIFICALTALIRRRRHSNREATRRVFRLPLKQWWAGQDRFSRTVILLLVPIVLTAFISGALVLQERPADPFTEFYLLDSAGLSMDYPREATVGETVVIRLGIANYEGDPTEYRIISVIGGNQALSTSEWISVADGATWEGEVRVVLQEAGDRQEIEILLERSGSPWPYRNLRIWMNVTPADDTADAHS